MCVLCSIGGEKFNMFSRGVAAGVRLLSLPSTDLSLPFTAPALYLHCLSLTFHRTSTDL